MWSFGQHFHMSQHIQLSANFGWPTWHTVDVFFRGDVWSYLQSEVNGSCGSSAPLKIRPRMFLVGHPKSEALIVSESFWKYCPTFLLFSSEVNDSDHSTSIWKWVHASGLSLSSIKTLYLSQDSQEAELQRHFLTGINVFPEPLTSISSLDCNF